MVAASLDVPHPASTAAAIMAVMMTGGIAIRSLHLLPDVFIAVFYTGLGTALALAGVLFAVNFFRVRGGAYPLEPAA